MKNLKEIDSIEDIRKHLMIAMQLEHATIPPYMTTLYSMNPENDKNLDTRGVIRVILREEMLHLTNAANILNAIGGSPNLTVDGFVPLYPTYLPDGEEDFKVSLQGFSDDAIKTFLDIERPKKPSEAPRGSRIKSFANGRISMISRPNIENRFLPQVEMKNGDVMHFYSIGEFYKAIELGLEILCEKNGDKNVFIGDESRQIPDESFWGGGGKVTKVINLESAKKAIKLIIDQGEGDGYTIYEDPNSEEISHYYRFQQLKLGRYYQKNDVPGLPTGPELTVDYSPEAVFPIKANCRLADCEGSEELKEAALDFNQFYKNFLVKLTTAYNGHPEFLELAIGDMFKIRDKIGFLMRNPLPNHRGFNAAPTFEIQ
jgi:hypothetical protein